MFWEFAFGVVYLVGGVLLAVYSRKIAVWDYEIDKKWKFLMMLGLPFRIWFLRIGGILLALLGFIVSAVYFMMG